jgi:myo-inositol-hexaphosphate 3-phosphohydrolase
MNKIKVTYFIAFTAIVLNACEPQKSILTEAEVFPVVTTDTTPNDTDDPAIWYNKLDPEKSLILGTDKGDSTGGIFVFDLKGKLQTGLSIYNLSRPNNIDIEYGFNYKGKLTDIAVFTERGRDMIRILSLPDCKFIDNGGIPVFVGDSLRAPMGIGLYKDKKNDIYAFVGRKTGPAEGYIFQYKLTSDDSVVIAQKIRSVGKFSGKKEIESIVVDDELGYLYYSDETVGIKKYYADAEKGNQELALFAQTGVTDDHEGLSIYKMDNGEGYIILSDQQANKFQVYTRNGTKSNPHYHQLVRTVKAQTIESDGSDILNMPFGSAFPRGLFVAMSTNKTFQFYNADDIVGIK